jgi:hypothetical protein
MADKVNSDPSSSLPCLCLGLADSGQLLSAAFSSNIFARLGQFEVSPLGGWCLPVFCY